MRWHAKPEMENSCYVDLFVAGGSAEGSRFVESPGCLCFLQPPSLVAQLLVALEDLLLSKTCLFF